MAGGPSRFSFILAAMTIEQIKRKIDKMKNAQQDYAGRQTPLPPKEDKGPDEPTHTDAISANGPRPRPWAVDHEAARGSLALPLSGGNPKSSKLSAKLRDPPLHWVDFT
jgi:hypothetical protein